MTLGEPAPTLKERTKPLDRRFIEPFGDEIDANGQFFRTASVQDRQRWQADRAASQSGSRSVLRPEQSRRDDNLNPSGVHVVDEATDEKLSRQEGIGL